MGYLLSLSKLFSYRKLLTFAIINGWAVQQDLFFGKTFAFIKSGGKTKRYGKPKGTRVCLTGDDSLTVAAPAPYTTKNLLDPFCGYKLTKITPDSDGQPRKF